MVIYDVAAHIGYHTLSFAQRVGAPGRVVAFEPHPAHQERIRTNLARNTDLSRRVTLKPIARSNSTGHVKFSCAESIEDGASSASFIDKASTPFPRSEYGHHRSLNVATSTLEGASEAVQLVALCRSNRGCVSAGDVRTCARSFPSRSSRLGLARRISGDAIAT
ncbi:MAG: FkbM family methyltransferase [Chthoniobacterales bacterium]|nr:FkbM family methyltransferase [Chthoniobacterales bacterium]